MDGVIAFYTAKDIPGKNTCVSSTKPDALTYSDEQVCNLQWSFI